MPEFDENYFADIGGANAGARDHRFDMLIRSPQAQVVLGSLPPGHTSNRSPSTNRASDQILYIVEGEASAAVNGANQELSEGQLLLIPAKHAHQVTNTGSRRLLYLDFFAGPPPSTGKENE